MSGYLKRVKPLVKVNDLFHIEEDAIWAMFDRTMSIMFDGHFELLSKWHSDMFFRFAAISRYPHYVSEISKEMIAWIEKNNILSEINVVLGTTSQGMFFAYDIASKMEGVRVAYALFDEGTGRPIRKLAEGFNINKNDRVLIVNDITTSGTGINTMINLVEKDCHAKVIGVCLFANRSRNVALVEEIKDKVKIFHSIIDIEMPSWLKDKDHVCQLCEDGVPLIYGRELHHLPIYSKEDEFERIIKYRQEHQYQRQECQPHCN
jgi:orotate phosphoribosyltransferase